MQWLQRVQKKSLNSGCNCWIQHNFDGGISNLLISFTPVTVQDYIENSICMSVNHTNRLHENPFTTLERKKTTKAVLGNHVSGHFKEKSYSCIHKFLFSQSIMYIEFSQWNFRISLGDRKHNNDQYLTVGNIFKNPYTWRPRIGKSKNYRIPEMISLFLTINIDYSNANHPIRYFLFFYEKPSISLRRMKKYTRAYVKTIQPTESK